MSFLFHVKDSKVAEIHECWAVWSMFPELDLSMKVNLDEPDIIFEDTEGGMEHPPFCSQS